MCVCKKLGWSGAQPAGCRGLVYVCIHGQSSIAAQLLPCSRLYKECFVSSEERVLLASHAPGNVACLQHCSGAASRCVSVRCVALHLLCGHASPPAHAAAAKAPKIVLACLASNVCRAAAASAMV